MIPGLLYAAFSVEVSMKLVFIGRRRASFRSLDIDAALRAERYL